MATEGRAELCVAEQEEVFDSAREEMSSGLKDKSSRSLFLCGRSFDVQL